MSRGPKQWDSISEARLAQVTILHLCSRLCQIQTQAGHLEQPAGSCMLSQKALEPVIRATFPAILDMCWFNLELPGSDRLLRKRTVTRSTMPEMIQQLNGTLCKGNHLHQQVAGSAQVNGRTVPVSRFAASYSRGFAKAVAQILLGLGYAARAFPAFEPPRTRKRFKTPVRAQPVSNPVERKRNMPSGTRAPKKSRVQELPDLEIPQVFEPEQWQSVPQDLVSCAVRVGTCSISAQNRAFQRIQELLPKLDISGMFISRDAKQMQMPIGAPPPSEAPWRVTLGWPESRHLCLKSWHASDGRI